MTESPAERAAHVARVLRAQGHAPDAEDVDRVARLLAGELTIEAAYAEVRAQFGVPGDAAHDRPVRPDRVP